MKYDERDADDGDFLLVSSCVQTTHTSCCINDGVLCCSNTIPASAVRSQGSTDDRMRLTE